MTTLPSLSWPINAPGGMKKFARRMGRAIVKSAKRLDQEVMRENLVRMLYQEPIVRPDGPRMSEALRRVSRGYLEIGGCYERLKLIPIYAARSPERRRRLSRADYLRYHVEAYLHETYMLQVRLLAYLTTLERDYMSEPQGERLRKVRPTLSRILEDRFGPLREQRRLLVHAVRPGDAELTELDLWEQFQELRSGFPSWYDVRLRAIRSSKVKWMRQTNVEIAKLLDTYFELVGHVVFDRRGRPVDPRGGRKTVARRAAGTP